MKPICQTLLLLSVLLLPPVCAAQVRFVAGDCIEPEGYALLLISCDTEDSSLLKY